MCSEVGASVPGGTGVASVGNWRHRHVGRGSAIRPRRGVRARNMLAVIPEEFLNQSFEQTAIGGFIGGFLKI